MKSLLLSLLPLLAAGSPVLIDTIHNQAAPVVSSINGKEIPNSYMVIFKSHVTERAAQDHHLWVQDIHAITGSEKMELRKRSKLPFQDTVFEGLKHTYHIPGRLLGYSGHFDEDVIEQVRRHQDVSQSICSLRQLVIYHFKGCWASFQSLSKLIRVVAPFQVLYLWNQLLTCFPG
jgi:cerevisin